MTRDEIIDYHASFHLFQIQMEVKAARKVISRMASFPARSAGQRRRFQRIKQGGGK